MIGLNQLGDIELFADLPPQIAQEAGKGRTVSYHQGELLFREGEEATFFFIVLSGTVEIYRLIEGQKLVINYFEEGAAAGELPLLTGLRHLGNALAVTEVTLLQLPEEDFWVLLGKYGQLRKRILSYMATRLQQLQLLSFQREKLVSLGTIAAGLVHELNNPAAAARSASKRLSEVLLSFTTDSASLLKEHIFKQASLEAFPLQAIHEKMQLAGLNLSGLQQSLREDELISWLEECAVEEAYEYASNLVQVGFTKEFLGAFTELLLPQYVPDFLRWLAKDVEMRLICKELGVSTTRISELVSAVKSYSYMDQEVGKVPVNLHEGISNTLVILNHKLKLKGISVQKQYASDIPLITAYGGELNQVWTNLINNAIEALPTRGSITLRTSLEQQDNGRVLVEVIDDGPGIPAVIQPRIFDPFFTTKEIGEGTGIGLDISYRIVVDRHKGSMHFSSVPGCTIFQVRLPLKGKTD